MRDQHNQTTISTYTDLISLALNMSAAQVAAREARAAADESDALRSVRSGLQLTADLVEVGAGLRIVAAGVGSGNLPLVLFGVVNITLSAIDALYEGLVLANVFGQDAQQIHDAVTTSWKEMP